MATFTAADRVGSVGGYIGGISALSGILNNIVGGMGAMSGCGNSGNMPISRYEATLLQENAAKDSEIAILKADKYTDEKLTEDVYKRQKQYRTILTQTQQGWEKVKRLAGRIAL